MQYTKRDFETFLQIELNSARTKDLVKRGMTYQEWQEWVDRCYRSADLMARIGTLN